MEVILNQLLPEDCDEKIRNDLMDFLKDFHNQEKVLIILDGEASARNTSLTTLQLTFNNRFYYVDMRGD